MVPPDDARDAGEVARLRPVLFDLWLPRGPELSWQVLSMRGSEALSQPYEFELELWCDDVDADFEQVLGADCELLFDRNGFERRIYGVIAEFELLLATELRIDREGIGARVKMVPAFRLLEHELDTRFFAGQTVIEILASLLGARLADYQRTLDVESYVKGDYQRRDYCVQFRESTFDFCSRIMEEEGIAYMFVGDDDQQRERMVLIDNNEDYPAVELLLPGPIVVELDRPEQLDRESLQSLHWRNKPTPTRVLARGYNYKLSNPIDEGEAADASEQRSVVREQVQFSAQRQIIDDPRDDPDALSFDGSTLAQQVPLARRLLEAHRVDAARGHGRSNAIGFAAGTVFELERPLIAGPRGSQFLLTRVVHVGRVEESDESTSYAYYNQFECIAREQPYRPARKTAKPRVHGVQTGMVIGKNLDEVHTDRLGRVQVAFPLSNHGQADAHAACWIRVAQIWAGPGYGAMVIPRVGMEVVVSFVDGDPDRPLVTGCVYNGSNLPPYELPSELSKSTFKTSSTPGSEHFSEIRFEDAKGSEQLFVRAQRRMDLRVQGTMYATCTGNREELVGGQRETGEPNAYVLSVVGEMHALVDGTELHYVTTDSYSYCEASLYQASASRQLIHADDYHQLSAPTIVTQAKQISQRADLITLAGSDTISLKAGARLVLESNNAVELRVGNSFISVHQAGVDINGYTVRLNSGGGVGYANEALNAERFVVEGPYDALPADDGRIHAGGSGRGGGGGSRKRKRRRHEIEPPEPSPMVPPKQLPPKPSDVIIPHDIDYIWMDMDWKHDATWCSEPASLQFWIENPLPGDHQTAYIQNAADGEVVTAVGVTARHGTFEVPVMLCDILPRTLPDGVEQSRELKAYTSNRMETSKLLNFRFLTDLPRMSWLKGRSMFGVEIQDHKVIISSTIRYVRGAMGRLISLGDLAPEDAGGLIGIRLNGTTDWRYCKPTTLMGDPDRLLFWDGQAWRVVPKEFDKANALGDKLLGSGLWRDGDRIGVQWGELPWPDELPAWEPKAIEELERAKVRWVKRVNEYWTGKFDLKRDQCRGLDPRCCRYPVECKIGFLEVDQVSEGVVVIGRNYARANSRSWPLDAEDLTVIHEFGHHLGNPDEYPGASTVNIWVNGDGAVLGIDKQSVMGEGSEARRRHFDTVCEALAKLVKTETNKSFTFTPVRVLLP